MKISTVVFDLDGTLLDSLDDLTDSVNYMLGKLERPLLPSSTVRGFIGKGARNLVQQVLSTKDDLFLTSALDIFTSHHLTHNSKKSRLYPGVTDTLKELSEKGLRMALLSNKNEKQCRVIMKALGIDHFFEEVCGGDTFTEMKPSPLPLLKLAAKLGSTPEEIIMVGDSVNDIQSARDAGAATIACSWGYGNIKELEKADYLVNSMSEVAEVIKKPFKNLSKIGA